MMDMENLSSSLREIQIENFLKFWYVVASKDFKDTALSFIRDLQNFANLRLNFIISLIDDINLKSFVEEINKYKLKKNTYTLFIAILPRSAAHLYHILKSISQDLLNTISNDINLLYITNSIVTKARVKIYKNDFARIQALDPRAAKLILGKDVLSGTIVHPHLPRYHSFEGLSIHGTINISSTNIEITYDKIAFVTWPTFYTGDRVTFQVKFNEDKTHFAVYRLNVTIPLTPTVTGELRFEGYVNNYNNSKCEGTFYVTKPCDKFGDKISFRTNEFFAPTNYLVPTNHARYEFSIVKLNDRSSTAIRILQKKRNNYYETDYGARYVSYLNNDPHPQNIRYIDKKNIVEVDSKNNSNNLEISKDKDRNNNKEIGNVIIGNACPHNINRILDSNNINDSGIAIENDDSKSNNIKKDGKIKNIEKNSNFTSANPFPKYSNKL